jgi:D-alanyl-D-alanine carboxypeptidase/D-alanyl-D-alanine-endopeptidase (penicillin-binding protein 4)
MKDMAKIFIFILTCFLGGVSFSAFAKTSSPKSVNSSINNLINEYNLPSNIGVQVQLMKSGKIIYSKNADHLFMPASNLKLFTSAAALLYLKPDYVIQTTLMTDSQKMSQGVLLGNVYLKFNGDPVFTTQDLNQLIVILKQKGIQTIKGNFYIDGRDFGGKKYGSGWMWDDLNNCYAAPIGTVIMNQNCFDSLLTSAKQANHRAHLNPSENSCLTPINNQVVTTNNSDTSDCPLELKSNEQNHYLLTGCMAVGSKPIKLQIAIKNPERYTAETIKLLLKANHIQLKGKILNATSPDNLILLAAHQSPKLSELVKVVLKDSNDLVADALMMQLAKNYYHQPATWHNGVKAIQAILLKQAHINLSSAKMVDGSGISTYNLVTPQQLSQLLYFVYHDSTIKPYFIAALPIAGVDGTLKNRMTADHLGENLRAKTGTLTGVSSLSGYVKAMSGQTFSFVIIVNNFLEKDAYQVESMEDAIGKLLFLKKIKSS